MLEISPVQNSELRIPLIFLGGDLLGSLGELRAAQLSGDLELRLSQVRARRRKLS